MKKTKKPVKLHNNKIIDKDLTNTDVTDKKLKNSSQLREEFLFAFVFPEETENYFKVVDFRLRGNDKNVIPTTTLSVRHRQFLFEYHLKYPFLLFLLFLQTAPVPVLRMLMVLTNSPVSVYLLLVDYLKL